MRSNCNNSSSGCWEPSVPEMACSDPVGLCLYFYQKLEYTGFKTYSRVGGVRGKEPYRLFFK